MSPLPIGPYETVETPDGLRVPYYIIPFDKRGVCEGPGTREALIKELRQGEYTNVYLFSHGWNNDWTVATERYKKFIEGFGQMRQNLDLPLPDTYKPLLVGIFWPSTALVFGEGEKGPDIAAGIGTPSHTEVGEERAAIRDLADELSAADASRFFELTQARTLDEDGARELAALGAKLSFAGDTELGDDEMLGADEILANWQALDIDEDDLDDFGTLDGAAGADAQAAGIGDFFKKLDPRKFIRMLTVRKMKDRAGVVGLNGVGPLLWEILAACQSRVHLIGHSYGGKVVLASSCIPKPMPRLIDSMLLLQPAVSHLCFASAIPGLDRPGGYRDALARVQQPILSTFSKHDSALTKFFHIALRRKVDVGEIGVAGAPSRYAALGGFGPREAGERLIPMQGPPADYALDDAIEVYGLKSDDYIDGHGDISNQATWWTLYQQVKS